MIGFPATEDYWELQLDRQRKIDIFEISYFAAHARFPSQSEIDRFINATKEAYNEKIK